MGPYGTKTQASTKREGFFLLPKSAFSFPSPSSSSLPRELAASEQQPKFANTFWALALQYRVTSPLAVSIYRFGMGSEQFCRTVISKRNEQKQPRRLATVSHKKYRF